MLIHKITVGFVTQTYDTHRGCFISQEFTAGDQVDYETTDGEPVDPALFDAAYLDFEMKQPLAKD